MRVPLISIGLLSAVLLLPNPLLVAAQHAVKRLDDHHLNQLDDDKIGRREMHRESYNDPTDGYGGPPPYYSDVEPSSFTSATCECPVSNRVQELTQPQTDHLKRRTRQPLMFLNPSQVV